MQQDEETSIKTDNLQITKQDSLPKDQAKTKMLLAGIPEHLINNQLLAEAIKILPPHYNFEIYKTLHRI